MVNAVFRARPLIDDYLSLSADEHEIARLVGAGYFKGQPMAAEWVPPRVQLQQEYGDARDRVLGDFVNFVSGCLVLTGRSARALSEFLDAAGERLELDTDLPLVAWNCTRVIDALDPIGTRGSKYPSGAGYMRISHYSILRDVIADNHIFKVPERVGSDIFVSDRFAEVVSEHRLTGLELMPVGLVPKLGS